MTRSKARRLLGVLLFALGGGVLAFNLIGRTSSLPIDLGFVSGLFLFLGVLTLVDNRNDFSAVASLVVFFSARIALDVMQWAFQPYWSPERAFVLDVGAGALIGAAIMAALLLRGWAKIAQ